MTTDATTPGLPCRAAMQGIAGSLAGLAALGAVGASAPLLSTDTVTAACPVASSTETLFVLGGGFDFNNPNGNVADFFVRESRVTSAIDGWRVEASNTSATQSGDVSAQAVCAYFRT